MARKKKDTMEFRFYEIPQGESALVLYGDSWVRVYGHDELHLHFHNLTEIGICRYGDGNMYLDSDVYRYHDGTLTVIPENFPHITVSDGENNNFWEYIFFDLKSIVEEIFPQNPVYQSKVIESLNKTAMFMGEDKDGELTVIINSIIEEAKNKKPYYQKKISLFLKTLVIDLVRKSDVQIEDEQYVKGTNMAQIAAALDYVNKNYDNPMKANELAVICSMSETLFRRIFEEYINMSPMDYVNLIRIQRACDLMKKSNDSMDMVATKCGFATTSTFNRNFKKYLDTSPYQWKINPSNYEHRLLNFRISALKGW
mgnify:CR=1 FL=1